MLTSPSKKANTCDICAHKRASRISPKGPYTMNAQIHFLKIRVSCIEKTIRNNFDNNAWKNNRCMYCVQDLPSDVIRKYLDTAN